MSEPSVCDLTLLMRTRLLCGLYNTRSVSPRWRRLAQFYCLSIAVLTSIVIYFAQRHWDLGMTMYMIPSFVAYYVAIFVSLWTGDEYVYKFFNQSKLTDVTLDSPKIFSHLKKHVRRAYHRIIAYYCTLWVLNLGRFYYVHTVTMWMQTLAAVIDLLLVFSFATKFLIMAVFDARMLVLKRRLQRYGFRTIGRAQPQPYCQIYDEILQGLDATDNPLKILLFFDLFGNVIKFISIMTFFIFENQWTDFDDIAVWGKIVLSAGTLLERLFFSFGHVTFLESAAAHCDDMALFTVTQLIKNPSTEERRRMREFLGELERRGARYGLLRALPMNARFALTVFGFCTSQIIVIISAERTE